MSYTAGSFSQGQVPTTALWNELWSNDASFANGTGIQNGVVTSSMFSPTMLSGQVVYGTNGGSAGGTSNYLNMGGIKFCWGNTLNTLATNTPYGVEFQTTFTNVLFYKAQMGIPGTSAFSLAYFSSAPTTTAGVVVQVLFAGGAQVSTITWMVFGD